MFGPKPARVGYKRVSVTPSPEFSPHKAPISPLPLPVFFSPVLPGRVTVARALSNSPLHDDRKFQVLCSARGYCRRDTHRNTLRALCSLTADCSTRSEFPKSFRQSRRGVRERARTKFAICKRHFGHKVVSKGGAWLGCCFGSSRLMARSNELLRDVYAAVRR